MCPIAGNELFSVFPKYQSSYILLFWCICFYTIRRSDNQKHAQKVWCHHSCKCLLSTMTNLEYIISRCLKQHGLCNRIFSKMINYVSICCFFLPVVDSDSADVPVSPFVIFRANFCFVKRKKMKKEKLFYQCYRPGNHYRMNLSVNILILKNTHGIF